MRREHWDWGCIWAQGSSSSLVLKSKMLGESSWSGWAGGGKSCSKVDSSRESGSWSQRLVLLLHGFIRKSHSPEQWITRSLLSPTCHYLTHRGAHFTRSSFTHSVGIYQMLGKGRALYNAQVGRKRCKILEVYSKAEETGHKHLNDKKIVEPQELR